MTTWPLAGPGLPSSSLFSKIKCEKNKLQSEYLSLFLPVPGSRRAVG